MCRQSSVPTDQLLVTESVRGDVTCERNKMRLAATDARNKELLRCHGRCGRRAFEQPFGESMKAGQPDGCTTGFRCVSRQSQPAWGQDQPTHAPHGLPRLVLYSRHEQAARTARYPTFRGRRRTAFDACKAPGAPTAVCFTGASNAVGASDSGVRHRVRARNQSEMHSVSRSDANQHRTTAGGTWQFVVKMTQRRVSGR